MTELSEKFMQYMLINHVQVARDGQKPTKTFRAIPLSGDAAYLNMEWDPQTGKLVLCSKIIKSELQAIPKMGPSGEFIKLKHPVAGTPGVEMQRMQLDEFYEVHISDIEGIDALLKGTCINAKTFPYQEFLAKIETENVQKSKIISLT